MVRIFRFRLSHMIPSLNSCRSNDTPTSATPRHASLGCCLCSKKTLLADDKFSEEAPKMYNTSVSGETSDHDADPQPPTYAMKKKKKKKKRGSRKKDAAEKKMLRLRNSSSGSGFYFSSDEFVERDTNCTLADNNFLVDDEMEAFELYSSSDQRRRRTRRAKKWNKKGAARKLINTVDLRSKSLTEAEARLSMFQRVIPCGVEGKVKESFAVVKRSDAPYEDFKNSMAEMIIENNMFEAKDLEQPLHCFLALNTRRHHALIMEAFTEIWDTIFCR